MSFSIVLSSQARKFLARQDRPIRDRLVNRLRELAASPADPRLSKLLTLGDGKRSSRVGGIRIIFRLDSSERRVDVLAIVPRGKAYRGL